MYDQMQYVIKQLPTSDHDQMRASINCNRTATDTKLRKYKTIDKGHTLD